MFDPEVGRLIEKLRKIESLFDRPGTDGERQAAGEARDRLRARLRELGMDPGAARRPADHAGRRPQAEQPREYAFRIHDPWARKLFLALLRRYGIRPYRRPRQHRSTIMARVTPSFVDRTLWPQYEKLQETLSAWLRDVTEKVIAQAVWADQSEPEED